MAAVHRTWGHVDDDGTWTALRDFDQRLRRRFGRRYVKVILFGSRARGDNAPDSDADVAVVFRDRIGDRWSCSRAILEDTYEILLDTGLYIQPWPIEESWPRSGTIGEPGTRAGDPPARPCPMSIAGYLAKAETAVASAGQLLANGDTEGAANRAYYAMFHAARAALLSVGEGAVGKHGTIVGRFGLRFVKSSLVSTDLGRAINEAQQLRGMGDYESQAPEPTAVAAMVAKAEQFLVHRGGNLDALIRWSRACRPRSI